MLDYKDIIIEGITNYAIAEIIYGKSPTIGVRDESFGLPDYRTVHSQLTTRPNMTWFISGIVTRKSVKQTV